MKKIYLILSLLFVVQIHSQDLATSQTLVSSSQIYSFDRSDKTVQGTPYMDETFSPANVSADNTKIFNVRYNLVSDDMEVENEKKGVYAINKNILKLSVTFLKDNKTYHVFNYLNESGTSVNGYFILLSNINSKVKILLKESKIFKKRQEARSSYQDAKPASFKKEQDKYFIKIGDDNALLIPKNKKDVAKLFPKFESQISAFIKKNKIKTSSEEDLIKLALYVSDLEI